jgi:hypothetical protein
MILNNELESMRKEEALSRYFAVGTEENHKIKTE